MPWRAGHEARTTPAMMEIRALRSSQNPWRQIAPFFEPGFQSAVQLSDHPVVTLSQTSVAASRLPDRRTAYAAPNRSLRPQDRPGDSGQLVGEGDNGDIAMGAFKQRFRPPTERSVALSHIGQRRAGSMDQLLAERFVAALVIPSSFGLPPVLNC